MAGKRDQAVYDDEVKARALEVADEHGISEAARQTGVPEGTIKSWRSRSGRVSPPKGADVEDWAARRETVAEASWEVVAQAIDQAKQHLSDGKSSLAQSAMVTAGIAADKASALLRAVDEYHASNVRLAEGQGQLVAAAVRATLLDLGAYGPGRPLVGHYLRQATEEGTVVEGSAPGGARARAELEDEVLRRVPDEVLEREARRRSLTVAGPVAAIGAGEPDEDEDEDLEAVEADGVVVDEGRDQGPSVSRAEVLEALRDPGRVVISDY